MTDGEAGGVRVETETSMIHICVAASLRQSQTEPPFTVHGKTTIYRTFIPLFKTAVVVKCHLPIGFNIWHTIKNVVW